jgi:WD40 repeat protein
MTTDSPHFLMDNHKTVMKAFSLALKREAHVLTQFPSLFWQQLYNRLQWDENFNQILAPELRQRSTPGTGSWLRLKTNYRESQTLIRTLNYHMDGVQSCMYSPDGSLILSSSLDQTVKLSDVNSGQEIRNFVGHTDKIFTCSISFHSHCIASGGGDETIKLWDAITGREMHTLYGHNEPIRACAFNPAGTRIVSASNDNTLKIWDVATGNEICTLIGHTGWVADCAYSPDGKEIISASRDRSGNLYPPWPHKWSHGLCLSSKWHTNSFRMLRQYIKNMGCQD